MQSLSWYGRRLRAMTPGEVALRLRAALRDTLDRFLVSSRARPRSSRVFLDTAAWKPGFRVTDVSIGASAEPWPQGPQRDWCERLLRRADQIAVNRFTFFDLIDQDLGHPIDWHRDHKRGQATPRGFAGDIDYRDLTVAGDCKFVWEPNRHHQLVVLARAYRLTGEMRYATAVAEQIDSWLTQNPFGRGMNWRSPLELGIRLINWVWACDLIREAGVINNTLEERLLDTVHRHVWEIARKYSHGSSANNHLIGEAAGVFVATCYFADLRGAAGWRDEARAILEREILRQTYPDGGTREQALGYHLFVLQFFLIAAVVARRDHVELSSSFWRRLAAMVSFVGGLHEGGPAPMFGDSDDGYVLDLGDGRPGLTELFGIAAVVLGIPEFRTWAGAVSEPPWWLGRGNVPQFEPLALAAEQRLTSRAFPDSGYYVLQHGAARDDERISVVFDCGDLGYGPLAAHGHADALSIALRAFGMDILVDPGTYDYFSYPMWRDHFRATAAHNTVAVDGQSQSELLGPFLWGARAVARCLAWEPTSVGGRVTGEHDGYRAGPRGVRHLRTVELDGPARVVGIRDELSGTGAHTYRISFQAAEHCAVARLAENRFLIRTQRGDVELELDARLACGSVTGDENSASGWISRGYHQRSAAPLIHGTCEAEGDLTLVTRILIGQPAGAVRDGPRAECMAMES